MSAVDRIPATLTSSRMSESASSNACSEHHFSLPVLHQDAATFTLIVDAEFFEINPGLPKSPSEWDENTFKAVCPESFPSARLFIARPHAGRNFRGQIVAVQLELKDYDPMSGTRLLQSRLSQWSDELSGPSDKRAPAAAVAYDRRTGRAIFRPPNQPDPLAKAQYVPAHPAVSPTTPSTSNPQRPTLFSLIARLSDPSVTTVEQRFAIRQIITDYLNNEISHGKVFSYLGQVVGYQALDDIIKNLPPGPCSAPQTTLAAGKIQQSLLGQTLSQKPGGVVVGTAPDLTRASTAQRQEGPRFTPSVSSETVEGEDINNEVVRRHKALVFRAFVKPLRWLYPESHQPLPLMSWGQQAVMLDRRAFFIGGAPRQQQSSDSVLKGEIREEVPGGDNSKYLSPTQNDNFSSSSTTTSPPEPTFQLLRLLDLVSLDARLVKSNLEFCPPSMTGHIAHLGAFISGPLSLVQGGLLYLPTSNSIQASRVLSPTQQQRSDTITTVESTTLKLNNLLYGLDMVSKRWMILDESSELRPPPRHSHSSAIYPSGAEVITGTSAPYAKYLIIFGGIGSVLWTGSNEQQKEKFHSCDVKDLILLNDLWIYNFDTGNWTEIELSSRPVPRFGSSLTWISGNSLVLYGGEGRMSTCPTNESLVSSSSSSTMDVALGVPNGEREILCDSWILQISETTPSTTASSEQTTSTSSENITSVDFDCSWTKSRTAGPPRAHHAAIGLTACLPPGSRPATTNIASQSEKPGRAIWSSSVESAMKDLKSMGWMTQRAIFIISGTTKNADQIIYETPSIILGLVFPKPSFSNSFMVVWKTLDDIPVRSGHLGPPFKGRRNHTALYFDALAELPAEQMMAEELKRYSMKLKKEEAVGKDQPKKNQSVQETDTEDLEIEEVADPLRKPPYKPFGRTPTCVPCILVVGGFTEQQRQIKEDLWVLNLSKLLPKFLKSEVKNRTVERRLLLGMLLSGVKCTPSIKQLLKLEDDSFDDEQFQKSNAANFTVDELRIMKAVWSDPAKNYQPALYQNGIAASTGLIWSLATMVRHPLTPFSHLVDNAVQRHVHASNISVCFERWYGHEAISITDDGYGLTHRGLNLLMKRFGHVSDDLSKRHPDQFGLGFKLAVGRLAHNALVMTKTPYTFGVGLFSSPLNALIGTTNFAAPIACWSIQDGFPIATPVEESEFGQIVGMILHNSPIGTSAKLEEEFAKFKNSTGTRIILFGLRKDIPYPRILQNGQITYTSLRYPDLFSIPTTESTRPRFDLPESSEKPEMLNNMDNDTIMHDVSTTLERNTRVGDTGHETTNEELSISPLTASDVKDKENEEHGDKTKDEKETAKSKSKDIKEDESKEEEKRNDKDLKDLPIIRLPDGLSDLSIQLQRSIVLPPFFPLWKTPIHSIDYNLATYIYWSQLHASAKLYINGIELIPKSHRETFVDGVLNDSTPMEDYSIASMSRTESPRILKSLKETAGIELPPIDQYSNSLWRYLQKRLYHKLELPYLFEPKFGEEHGYGLIGFLNNHSNEKLEGNSRLSETGVLLYHKGRLINRAMLKIPALPEFLEPTSKKGKITNDTNILSSLLLTAVINVPDFLLPRATKEEFLAETDLAFQDFYDRLESTLQEYLEVYDDPEKLQALQKRYIKEFDNYRECRWMERRRLRIDFDDDMESETRPSKYQTIVSVSETEGPQRSQVPPDSPQNRKDRRRSPSISRVPTKGKERRTGRLR